MGRSEAALQRGMVEKSSRTGQVDLICLSENIFCRKYGCFVVASEKVGDVGFAVGRWMGWYEICDLARG